MPINDVAHDATESLTLVLPAYNEETRLGPALDELFTYLGQPRTGRPADEGLDLLPSAIRVLVVDDGSTDRTSEIVLEAPAAAPGTREAGQDGAWNGAWLDLLSIAHGGKGAAVRAGVIAADGDYVIFADADMATPPHEIPKLLAALRTHDVALGSRIQTDGTDMRQTQPMLRRMLGRLFHRLAAWWVAGPVRDTQCGFKGFRRTAAIDLFERQRIMSIVFDVELIYLARNRGYRVAVVPIQWFDRRGSRMRIGPRLALQVAFDLGRIPLIHRDHA